MLVGPDQRRQVFSGKDKEVLWLIIGSPEETEFLPGVSVKPNHPVDPAQLTKE